MVPTFEDGVWELEALRDSNFANDKVTRYSVYGYIIYFCGVPVEWKCKSMKHVALSTTEAQYSSFRSCYRDQVFVPNVEKHGSKSSTTYQGSGG